MEITREDGLVETIGASLFLGTSTVLFYCFCVDIKNRASDVSIGNVFRRNILILMLTVAFFAAFGEEISWGQRIFNIATPEILSSINVQNEITIHNLEIFNRMTMDNKVKTSFMELIINIERLFSIFWFSCFFVLPIASQSSEKIRNFVQRINFPLIPLWLASLFVCNYILSILAGYSYSSLENINLRNIAEVKECNFAFLFFIVGLICLSKVRNHSNVVNNPKYATECRKWESAEVAHP